MLTSGSISIDHNDVIGDSGDTVDLTDFPVLINESGTWLRNSGYTDGRIENPNGYDIIFKDATETTTLAHEIEYYNTNGSVVTYYFNNYGAERWNNYPNMTDGRTYYPWHSWAQADGATQLLTSNTCPGTDLGAINKVEIRAHASADLADEDDDIILRPVFGGTQDGDNHQVDIIAYAGNPPASPQYDWSAWIDITNDTNAPSTWTWSDVQNLDADVVQKQVGALDAVYATKVEVRVSYGPAKLVAWVKIPTLDADDDTTIYMYYGNGCITDETQDKNAVWNSSYKLVQHLQETSGTHEDSTQNINHSTSVTVTTQGSATGQMDGADEFDGSGDYISVADDNSLDLPSSFTVEVWARWASTSSNGYILEKGTTVVNEKNYYLWWNNDAPFGGPNTSVVFGFSPGTCCTDLAYDWTPTVGLWYHVVGVFDDVQNELRMYVGGTEVAQKPETGTPGVENGELRFGRDIVGTWGGDVW